ncbi:cellulose synthase-like protein E1 [Chenopodium quinoa]|uniref:cellulose synthase-like protein E1 n=1 Tax=Chenopodium quinoa TaxID=63459 RepID=UPI000B77DA6B|nr:cellulose synthase-like protein E1 [Chenopodium quinoa]
MKEARNILGPSTEFIKSLRQNDMPSKTKYSELCTAPVQEAQYLASCTYEENTKWGEGAGFWYKSVLEDAMTGYMLQSKGWRSVSDPFFIAFGFVFISSLVKHLCEVVDTGGSVRTWLNEQRIWKIKSLTCFSYGVADCVMAKLGLREASFIPTNKAEDSNKAKLYEMGKYDFSTSNMFLVPLVSAVSLNLCCFVGGVARVIGVGNWVEMFGQGILSLYGLIISYPVLEAMLVRQDKGCIPLSAILTSSFFVVLSITFGYFIF